MESGEFLARGSWFEDRIHITWRPDLLRPTLPEVEERIEREWTSLLASGRRVYDGQLCRVVDFRANAEWLEITAGPTTYREYRGTNRPGVPEETRANPLCVCAAAHTADGKVVVGRRSDTIGESEGLWHVAGGHVESGRHVQGGRVLPGVAMREELEEELGIPSGAIRELRCLGFTRPEDTLKPELLFYARLDVDFAELRPNEEHALLVPVEPTREACLAFAATHAMPLSGRACLKACADLFG